MRSVNEDGFGKKKREWNRRDAIKDYRERWAEYANQALERAGHTERIDHRSLKEQGVEREPQIHLGAKVLEMEARGVRTRVGDESRRISKVNRDIERRGAQHEKLQVEIEAEQVTSEPYVLPELVFPSESKIEAAQLTHTSSDESFSVEDSQQSDESLVPIIDLDLVRRLGEVPVRHREEVFSESLPTIEELAAAIEKVPATTDTPPVTAEEVSTKIDELLAQLEEIQRPTDGQVRQTQLEEERTTAPSAEKKTKSIGCQERTRRRQKKQARGMEP